MDGGSGLDSVILASKERSIVPCLRLTEKDATDDEI